jgi:hypothetical protein
MKITLKSSKINQEITGPAFLLLTIEELKSYGLKGGPSMIIAKLVKELK